MAGYQDKVIEAKRLIEVIEAGDRAAWDLARLCYDVVDGDGVEPGKFANDIGKSVGYVKQLRRTWEQFGDPKNRPHGDDLSFRDYRELAGASEDQASALLAVSRESGVSVGRAASERSDQVSAVREAIQSLPPKQKEEVARDIARDFAEERAAAVRSPEPRDPAVKEPTSVPRFTDTPTGIWAAVIRDLSGARHRLARALERLRETNASISPSLADDIREEAEALIRAAQKVKEAAEIGTVRISDEELARLLERG